MNCALMSFSFKGFLPHISNMPLRKNYVLVSLFFITIFFFKLVVSLVTFEGYVVIVVCNGFTVSINSLKPSKIATKVATNISSRVSQFTQFMIIIKIKLVPTIIGHVTVAGRCIQRMGCMAG